MTIYQAVFSFQSKRGVVRHEERSTKISFEQDDDQRAVVDAIRWWGNRHAAIPEHFHRVVALKLYIWKPYRVRDDGYLEMPTGFPFYEWKSDWGLELGQRRG